MMDGLIADRVFARETPRALVGNTLRCRNESALAVIVPSLGTRVEFYPKCIEKKDEAFFPASRGHCTEEGDQAMHSDLGELDRKITHEKWGTLVAGLEEDQVSAPRTSHSEAHVVSRCHAQDFAGTDLGSITADVR